MWSKPTFIYMNNYCSGAQIIQYFYKYVGKKEEEEEEEEGKKQSHYNTKCQNQ